MYQILVSILMLNILIAIMVGTAFVLINSVTLVYHLQNTTYAEVWESIDREWRYSKTYYQVKRKTCFLDLAT